MSETLREGVEALADHLATGEWPSGDGSSTYYGKRDEGIVRRLRALLAATAPTPDDQWACSECPDAASNGERGAKVHTQVTGHKVIAPTPDEVGRVEATRQALLALMREWSEDNYCAGWLIDLEAKLHKEGGVFETLGRAVGWPIDVDAKGGWETWDEAAARYQSDEWIAERPWLTGARA